MRALRWVCCGLTTILLGLGEARTHAQITTLPTPAQNFSSAQAGLDISTNFSRTAEPGSTLSGSITFETSTDAEPTHDFSLTITTDNYLDLSSTVLGLPAGWSESKSDDTFIFSNVTGQDLAAFTPYPLLTVSFLIDPLTPIGTEIQAPTVSPSDVLDDDGNPAANFMIGDGDTFQIQIVPEPPPAYLVVTSLACLWLVLKAGFWFHGKIT